MSRWYANNGEYDEWSSAARNSDPGVPYGYGELDASDAFDLAPARGPLPSLEETATAIRAAQARTHQEPQ